jgi:hypothetical protein
MTIRLNLPLSKPNLTRVKTLASVKAPLAERIGIFIGFLVNAAFDIADGLVF